MLLLDLLRPLSAFQRFILIPLMLLCPAWSAYRMHETVIAAHGPGAFGALLVAMLAALVLGAMFAYRHAFEYPATFTLGLLIMTVAVIIMFVASWHRPGLILFAFTAGLGVMIHVIGQKLKRERYGAPTFEPWCRDECCAGRPVSVGSDSDRFKPKGPDFPMVA